MKKFIMICVLALSACTDEEKAAQEFTMACAETGFSTEQCQFLYAMKKQSDNQAAAAQGMAGAAIGLGAAGMAK